MDRRFSSQIAEVVNRNALVTELLNRGFNAYLPVYDRGVDLIAYRNADGMTRPIQLKGRWMIDRKYQKQNVWIAFMDQADWYVAPHDEMVSFGEQLGFCATASWLTGGAYSCPRMSTALRYLMEPFRLSVSEHFTAKD